MSGYPVEIFIASPPKRYICELCNGVFKLPTQCQRGHVFCNVCIHSHLTVNETCPMCECTLTRASLVDNLLVRDMIDDMVIQCVTTLQLKSEGNDYIDVPNEAADAITCSWTGSLGNLEEHLSHSCGHAETACPNDGCGMVMQRRRLMAHDLVCDHKQLDCNHCHNVVKRVDQEQHDQVCPAKPVDCALGCGKTLPRQDLEEHLAEDCFLQQQDCPNAASIGCSATCPGRLLRRDLEAHLVDANTVVAMITLLTRKTAEIIAITSDVKKQAATDKETNETLREADELKSTEIRAALDGMNAKVEAVAQTFDTLRQDDECKIKALQQAITEIRERATRRPSLELQECLEAESLSAPLKAPMYSPRPRGNRIVSAMNNLKNP